MGVKYKNSEKKGHFWVVGWIRSGLISLSFLNGCILFLFPPFSEQTMLVGRKDFELQHFAFLKHRSVSEWVTAGLSFHFSTLCHASPRGSLLPWWRLHSCNQPCFCCVASNAALANLPTLISSPVTIYFSSNGNYYVFITRTDEAL